jgi:NitT/TauT family transport system substrate-binding protein
LKGTPAVLTRALAFALTLGLLTLGAPQGVRSADAPLQKMSIQLGSIPGATWSVLYLAKDEGLFAKEGLDVDVLPGKTSNDAINAVATGSVTMSVVLTLNQIINYDKGLKVIAVGSYLGKNAYGVGIATDGGSKGTLKDLAGKKILVTSAVNEALMRGAIKHAGGNPDASTYVLVPNPSSLIGTYVGKQADAVQSVLPFISVAIGQTRPTNYVAFSDSGDPEPGYIIVVKPETLATQKPMIAKALRAIYAAYQIANTDNAKMTATSIKTIPDATAASVNADWNAFKKFECDPAQKGKSFGVLVPANYETAVKFYQSVGILEHPMDAKSLYTNEFAEGPNAVTKMKCPQ